VQNQYSLKKLGKQLLPPQNSSERKEIQLLPLFSLGSSNICNSLTLSWLKCPSKPSWWAMSTGKMKMCSARGATCGSYGKSRTKTPWTPKHHTESPNTLLGKTYCNIFIVTFYKLKIIFLIQRLYKIQLESTHALAVDIISGRAMACVSDMERLTKIIKCLKLCDL